MDKMIEGVGASETPGSKPTTAAEEKAPTQMHALIALIKQEQDIYNIIFHEIIRQVQTLCTGQKVNQVQFWGEF